MTRRNPSESSNPETRYRQAHWGIRHVRTFEDPDPAYPDKMLVEMGRLRSFHVKSKGGSFDLLFSDDDRVCLAFDPGKAQKLYIVFEKKAVQRDVAKRLWRPEPGKVVALEDLQRTVGGRQARYPFPDGSIPVICLGQAVKVNYFTYKRGDDAEIALDGGPSGTGSEYTHRHGEESGLPPALAVDAKGRLWIVGGNYTVPNAGITD